MVSMDPDIAGFDEATADPEWAALAGALRQHYLQAPAPATESRHLAAMAAARPGRRRRRLAVAAAVGAVSLVGGTTLAAAGELPAPVQTGVAALAGHAHISLPGPHRGPSGRVDAALRHHTDHRTSGPRGTDDAARDARRRAQACRPAREGRRQETGRPRACGDHATAPDGSPPTERDDRRLTGPAVSARRPTGLGDSMCWFCRLGQTEQHGVCGRRTAFGNARRRGLVERPAPQASRVVGDVPSRIR
jgi:hypothetical protein